MADAYNARRMDGVGAMSDLTFRGDPALIQAQGSLTRALAFAEAEALRRQRELLVQYGDPNLTQQVLGGWTKPKTNKKGKVKNQPQVQQGQQMASADAIAAEKNPFSILKQIGFAHEQRERALNEGMNQQNGWYSSERGRQLGLEGRQTLLDRYNAEIEMRNALNQILSDLQYQRLGAQDQKSQAILDAQARQPILGA